MSQKPRDMPGPDLPTSERDGGRPRRWTVTDELGRSRTLGALETDYRLRPGTGLTVVLGLGPDPELAARLTPEGLPVAYVERPDCPWQAPEGWLRIAPEDLTPDALRLPNILVWKPGETLWPSFWGPILARLRVARLGEPPARPERRLAWIGCAADSLLVRELEDALAGLGWRTRRITAGAAQGVDPMETALSGLREERPDLFLSVNFHGLDSHGQTFHLLRESGCRVAAWFVDNPVLVLSGVRTAFWREVPLFATDATFLEPLRRLGARRVEHLPLAAWPGFVPTGPVPAGLAGHTVFVGRSEFPDKDVFFAASRVAPELLAEAASGLAGGERPDFHWWTSRLGTSSLWPGHAARPPGLGAQESGKAWRSLCLESAAATGKLTVYGDAGWGPALAGRAELREPVDYYGPLAGIYAGAGCVLNVTGMLLPAGLTQRHFDVWTAGGCLVTDANPGLDIFPADLTREIVFRTPDELPELCVRLGDVGNPRRTELIAAWRELIRAGHLYRHRVERVLMSLGLT